MKRRAVISYVLSSLVLCPFGIAGSSNRWKDLVVGESSPGRAVELLGQPLSDQVADLGEVRRLLKIGNQIKPDDQNSRFRILRWDNIGGFKSAILFFSNDLLVAVGLTPAKENKVLAADLPSIYSDAIFEPAPERNTAAYDLYGLAESLRTEVVALVTVPFAEQFGRDISKASAPPFPGRVMNLALISTDLLPAKRRMDSARKSLE
jgi:hypothetical protein